MVPRQQPTRCGCATVHKQCNPTGVASGATHPALRSRQRAHSPRTGRSPVMISYSSTATATARMGAHDRVGASAAVRMGSANGTPPQPWHWRLRLPSQPASPAVKPAASAHPAALPRPAPPKLKRSTAAVHCMPFSSISGAALRQSRVHGSACGARPPQRTTWSAMLQAEHANLPQHALLYCHAMPATPWQPNSPVKCADCSHVAEICAVLALAQPHVSQLGGARGRQQHIGALQCRGGKGQEPRNQQGKRPRRSAWPNTPRRCAQAAVAAWWGSSGQLPTARQPRGATDCVLSPSLPHLYVHMNHSLQACQGRRGRVSGQSVCQAELLLA